MKSRWSSLPTLPDAVRGSAETQHVESVLSFSLLVMLAAASLGAQQRLLLTASPLPIAAPVAFQILRAQAELVQEAESTYHARVVTTLPGWSEAVRDVERRTRLTWHGLPPVILIVPDRGRGFACSERSEACLGRYLGAMLRASGDSSAVMSSLILIAESAKSRPDVWIHELTHALLSQNGRVAESQRHDRRYFSEESFVRVEF